MTSTYYNTTSIKGSDLAAAHKQCGRQEEYVLGIFKDYGQIGLTVSETEEIILEGKRPDLIKRVNQLRDYNADTNDIIECVKHDTNLKSSVGRSITNLMNDGHLKKTDRKRRGVSGRKNYVYECSNLLP